MGKVNDLPKTTWTEKWNSAMGLPSPDLYHKPASASNWHQPFRKWYGNSTLHHTQPLPLRNQSLARELASNQQLILSKMHFWPNYFFSWVTFLHRLKPLRGLAIETWGSQRVLLNMWSDCGQKRWVKWVEDPEKLRNFLDIWPPCMTPRGWS